MAILEDIDQTHEFYCQVYDMAVSMGMTVRQVIDVSLELIKEMTCETRDEKVRSRLT